MNNTLCLMKRHGVFPIFSFIGLCKSTNGKFVAPFSNIKPKHLIRPWPDQTQTRLRCKGPCQLRVCHWLRRCKQIGKRCIIICTSIADFITIKVNANS